MSLNHCSHFRITLILKHLCLQNQFIIYLTKSSFNVIYQHCLFIHVMHILKHKQMFVRKCWNCNTAISVLYNKK